MHIVWNSLNVTYLLLSASGATEPWHWDIANPPLPSMLGFPSGTPSAGVRCDGNCSSQAQTCHVTLNRLWRWWGQGPHPHPGPWRLLLVARTKLGAAVCFTTQLPPTPSVLQGTAPHLFSTFLPRCREQKSTHSTKIITLIGAGRRLQKRERFWGEKGRKSSREWGGLNQHSLVQLSSIMTLFYIYAAQYDSHQNLWILST